MQTINIVHPRASFGKFGAVHATR